MDLIGPHDPYLLTATDLSIALERFRADLPDWPVVLIAPYGAPCDCLCDQPRDAFTGPVARHAFIGRTRKAGRIARSGFAWYARPAGSTVAGAVHCRTYSEALRVAAGLA
jgi:hypothetical protein